MPASSEHAYSVGRRVRILRWSMPPATGVVARLTRSLIVLHDGSRWSRKTLRMYGDPSGRWNRIEAKF